MGEKQLMNTPALIGGGLLLSVAVGLVIWASIVEPGFRYAAAFILTFVTGALMLLRGLHG